MSINEESRLFLRSTIKSRNLNYKISFPIGNNKDVKLPIGKVIYIKADGILSKCFLFDSNKNHINIATPFKELEDDLRKYAFIRTHRSFIVNCSFVKNWEYENNGTIEMFCGTQIPIARRKKTEILYFLKAMGLEQ